jgi:MSHA biogenesis protein MshL
MALALLLSGGCQTVHRPGGEPAAEIVEDAVTETLRDAIRPPPHAKAPPEAVAEALLPPIRLDPRKPSVSKERRYDISVSNAPAREFFMSLVDETPYNMVLDPDVEGMVSLDLKNVTIEDALTAVHDVYGYAYRKTPYGYQVSPAGGQTRIFKVDYLNLQRAGSSSVRVSAGRLSSSGGEGEASGGSGGGAGTVSSEVSSSSAADLWGELSATLNAIVGGAGTVVLSPNAGLVIVHAPPAEMRQVESYLETAQRNLQRQVIIEAKIIEVSLSEAFEAGINWALLGQSGSNTILGGLTRGGTNVERVGVSTTVGQHFLDVLQLPPPMALSQLVLPPNTGDFGGVFSLAAQLNDLNVFLELLESQGSVKVLSSPRVSTVNNQTAIIKIGSDEFFVTEIASTTTTGAATTTTPEITLDSFFSGIALEVTPQISEESDVILHIHPTVSEVTDQTKTITVFGLEQSLPLALSQIRESDSVVRVKDGQVVVIGGLMGDSLSDARQGTPWFGRIPIIGHLFRHSRDSSLKSELVILLRAKVVGMDTWTDEIRQASERIEKLKPMWELDQTGTTPGP